MRGEINNFTFEGTGSEVAMSVECSTANAHMPCAIHVHVIATNTRRIRFVPALFACSLHSPGISVWWRIRAQYRLKTLYP